jgi:2-polyprenyl-3-methyl-5-hydroxy-6-metoxy-1,4-benzoquinol methylase
MQFDFGENWLDYSKRALTPERIDQAKADLRAVTEGIKLDNKRFLDIGFGQGLTLLNAASMGAKVTGCDSNPKCTQALELTRAQINDLQDIEVKIVVGSILNEKIVSQIRQVGGDDTGRFDIVHSWGVLHHTGNMAQAIDIAASLVNSDGYLILALYNRHWSSTLWHFIKRSYCCSPKWIQLLLIWGIYPVIWVAKLLVTGRNPFRQQRGMDFFYNVVDWVGGYPYEYACVDEVHALLEKLGFQEIRVITTEVPTGCNEFVYRRNQMRCK